LLLKGLIAAVFPAAAAFLFLLFTRKLLDRQTWRRLHPFSGFAIAVAIAAPWHILATLRNPPYWYSSLSAGPGQYHGFFWFYFVNEHILRFLNRRYPRDYNTVPRLWFWLYHLIWLFPWSVFFPEALRSLWKGTGPDSRGSRTRLLALCWTGFILVFFSLSTSQEYYSLPAYPALVLIIGAALSGESAWIEWGRRVLGAITGLAAASAAAILIAVRNVPTPGDIAEALTQNPELYTLSLGHMGDLTLKSFAYLRLPLALAAAAFLIGTFSAWFWRGIRSYIGIAIMMVVFFHAGRVALIAFDPYLASRPLAKALVASPPGELIADDQYYAWSSVFFYANRKAFLLNGRVTNLEYGSNAPDAPRDVFIDDGQFVQKWKDPARRYYLLAERPALSRFDNLVGRAALHTVAESGGKYLFTNLPVQ
jgi:4-amino-4-deoxy-L-arabinose transferase-like glycosyltransferase